MGEERTRVRMEMVMYLDAWRPRALPVAGRVIAGLLCGGDDDDGICISNHRLTHLKYNREELHITTRLKQHHKLQFMCRKAHRKEICKQTRSLLIRRPTVGLRLSSLSSPHSSPSQLLEVQRRVARAPHISPRYVRHRSPHPASRSFSVPFRSKKPSKKATLPSFLCFLPISAPPPSPLFFLLD